MKKKTIKNMSIYKKNIKVLFLLKKKENYNFRIKL